MKIRNILKHTGIIIVSVVILLGVPLWFTGYMNTLFSDHPDAISSASVILDQPSGNYVVMINKKMHPDENKLKDWITFFSGGDVLYIFEDISASTASGDAGGIEMAQSFRSRLPENQMRVVTQDATLMLSRADHGLYDIMIMSEEFADSFHADTAFDENSVVIKLMDLPGNENHFGGTFATVK